MKDLKELKINLTDCKKETFKILNEKLHSLQRLTKLKILV